MSTTLFSPVVLGTLSLKNRVVMAPMTRSRAIGNVPNALMATYYRQRAGAGLILTEGTSPGPNGLGYARIPGVFTAEQVRGWRLVTDGVHEAGGRIFVQLMHTGRVSHPGNMQAGARILAPSAIAAPGEMWTDADGQQPYPVPIEMSEADIVEAIAGDATAASRGIEAGFDGVELHGANGYLIDQFLNTASNRRTDRWGSGGETVRVAAGQKQRPAGNEANGVNQHAHRDRGIDNRIRFAVAVARATAEAIGAERVGMRISPYGVFNGMAPDADMDQVYERLITGLNRIGLASIHVVDHSSMGAPEVSPVLKATLRAAFDGWYILSGGYDADRASADLAAHRGDLVAFGRPYIANPDLAQKLQSGQALAVPDPATFYTPGEKGYTDYPA
ncbi:MAG: alkene reductase [Acidobacteria bacterium]|nr:alkene reductase [Acidobacteriota bacterium]